MAVGIRIKLPGVTEEQFDRAHDHANPDRTPPKGLLFHASGPIDGGWGIIDYWESREDFDAFSGRVVEGMAAAGVQPERPPDIKEFPVQKMIPAWRPPPGGGAWCAGVSCREAPGGESRPAHWEPGSPRLEGGRPPADLPALRRDDGARRAQ